MRAFLALVLFVPMAATAAPSGGRMLQMPAAFLPNRHSPDENFTLRTTRLTTAGTGPVTMSFGPIEAEIGGGGHVARYRLSGARVLGGSVSGSIDGRGAKIFLRWPNK